ncbi:protein phosphatase 2C domain-containing protein, partial [Kibdelosporangium lantanae]
VADGWSTNHFTVRAASVRGYAHRYQGIPREDDFATAITDTGALVVAVADGVSGATQSHVGATIACRTAVDFLLHNKIDWADLARCASWALVEYASRGLPNPDPTVAERTLATTLVVALIQPDGHATIVQLGDSGAWLLRDRKYENLVRGKHGDVIPNDVTALPRVPPEVVEHTTTLTPQDVLLIATDGFGDPLGDGTGQVGSLFADHLTTPPAPLGLAHLLDFSRETYDDDRTLVAIWRRP